MLTAVNQRRDVTASDTGSGEMKGDIDGLKDQLAFPDGVDAEMFDIAIVDDDPAILHTTTLMLQGLGARVAPFTDPLDALMWASDAEPCCIIVDLKMPGVEGLDLVSAFCALQKHVVILLSAYVDILTTVDAMRLGVDNVLSKPVSDQALSTAILRGRRILATSIASDSLVFTRRERQVAERLLDGMTTKQIAKDLELSPRTVEFFRTSLLRKTQSPNTAALAAALARIGFGPGAA